MNGRKKKVEMIRLCEERVEGVERGVEDETEGQVVETEVKWNQ